ncbi:DNA polymerase-3 subunit alpha [Lachnospiraceae bacterium C10]|nr:DNA polymerase-3 subunit alpha [Lachnospiraceae bacterium C10]
MERAFFDVFHDLKDDSSVNSPILSAAKVCRMTTTKDRSSMRIYLKANALIPKRVIWRLEQSIKKYYFKQSSTKIHIIESFELSEQYTPQKLYDVYRDSILEEIHQYSALLFQVFVQTDLLFEDNHLTLVIPDHVVGHAREEELIHVMEKIFCQRCGQNLVIDCQYKEPVNGDFGKKAEKRIHQQIASIVQRIEAASNGLPSSDTTNDDAVLSAPNPYERADEPAVTMPAAPPAQPEKKRTYSLVRSNNPDTVYGRDVSEDAIDISEIQTELGEIVIRGQIIACEYREIRNEKTIAMLTVTDFTDSIRAKLFLHNDQVEQFQSSVHEGMFIKLKGNASEDAFDHEISIGSVRGINKIPDFRTPRMDTAPEKRVELHCHTKMSDMDGVSDVKEIIKQAKRWGHKAIAITDHGVVQAFPDADHAVDKDDDFKVIYGCEIYLVDDTKTIATNEKNQSLDDTYVVFDIETTGLNAAVVDIIEIGAVKFEHGEITERFSEFVNPHKPIPYHIVELTSITDEQVKNAPGIDVILPKFKEFCEGAVLVAHNADFDTGCIHATAKRLGIDWDFTYVDTMPLARYLLPSLGRLKLDNVAKALNVSLEHHHRAIDDAECTAHIFDKLSKRLQASGIHTLKELNQAGAMDVNAIRKGRTHHCIVLAKNDIGRINLYRLCSLGNLKYYQRFPRIPKSEILKHREGLIIGSACEAGELYQALLYGKDNAEISRIVQFYDYLEIQPNGNNAFLLRDEKSGIETEEDLNNINRKIVALGEEFHKPVVATCDVHFLNPEDEIYRRIIQVEKGFSDADMQPPLYLHTTDEMMQEFAYLGSEKAEEVVIKNPGRIADMCEKIHPTRPDKCPPVIENSDEMLRKICYNKAHEMYGETLPPQVKARLDRELNSIISNGYAVMYIIAQKLVWKSNEDGYLVGSRGSVGSSFVATMAGITEVNPLSPHYLCPKCHYVDFDSEEVLSYSGNAGCDMPDKLCPVCGHELNKEGFDIPFETFLGFKGNKEPDIDLNFSGDYQSKAHAYTAVIFGDGQTFKAGTIGTLADKTAFGYIKHYYEDRGIRKRNCEVDRIVQGCVGVRRTTGQHPGGIIVLPVGEEINTFTPIQHPANDMTSDIITTHFDYHSIDSNLLKLDILGHDDPTMIRMLEDLTGLHATEIPLDDKGVMQLFKDTSSLGVEPSQLWKNTPMGTLGIPEFGTDFAMGLLKEAKPQEFSDLIRISGLSHGTDVWQGNAEVLINEGIATISTAICCRDDIMVYLIHMGMDPEESFTIMERVRKGIVAKGKCKEWPEYKEKMRSHGVPDWYIGSCEKIKYMFPKAHAAAYVMMAWRVAYCKVYYPLAYYAAFFSIRATDFSYEKMCLGQETLEHYLKEIDDKEKAGEKLTAKDKGSYKDMRIVQEMYARGFEFLPMDLYRSDARYFQIIDGKLLPPFSSIEGMGDKAAETLAIAASQKEFLSKDDLKERGKISATICETMDRLGILPNLPESNQLSMFDFID